MDFQDRSPLWKLIMEELSTDTIALGSQRPKWRLIFGGPLIMTNYYRNSYSSEIVAYIKELVTAKPDFIIPGGDPFIKQDFLDFAFSENFKGEKFFSEVRE